MKKKKKPRKDYRKNSVVNRKMRAVAFVDGFNLFHALKKCDPRDRWCNIRKLIESKMDEKNISLEKIWWFTAYYHKDKKAVAIHKEYARALDSVGVQRFLGEYNSVEKVFCKKNHKINYIEPEELLQKRESIPNRIEFRTEEEKKTDVNIAVKIVEGAFLDLYDIAYIVSGDSDLYTAIEVSKRHFKEKKFINLLPPLSKGKSIGRICDEQIALGKKDVEESRFPDVIKLSNAETINIPAKYLKQESIPA